MYLDLFASGDDFSWNTIQSGRNQYYQRQLANQIQSKTTATLGLLSNALNVHLNMGQNMTMNTSSIFMSLETVSIRSLGNRLVQQSDGARTQMPSSLQLDSHSHPSVSLRVRSPSPLHRFLLNRLLLVYFSLLVNHAAIGYG